jgi:predicted outer membrane repeat protein
VLTDVDVSDNLARDVGGGMYSSGETTGTISGCRFTGNVAVAGAGGGLYDSATGDTTISATTFSGNGAGGGSPLGGGLYRSGGGGLTMEGSTFSDNEASGGGGAGGGVFNASANPSTVTNSTFSANQAGSFGGGFYAASTVTLTNVTFSGNGAAMGGGVSGGGPVTLVNTILAGSTAGGNCGGPPVTSGGNNIDDGTTCALAGAGDRSSTDPMLGPLQDNGGPTQTHGLLEGGPAIDTGGAGACPATDQRGTVRPADGNGDGTAVCDVGAYEFVDECPADPAKVVPGACGCGVPDVDANANGAYDCLINAELKARIARARTLVGDLTGERNPTQRGIKAELKQSMRGIVAYVKQHQASIVLADPTANLGKLARRAQKRASAAARKRGRALTRAKSAAATALDQLDAAVAPQ